MQQGVGAVSATHVIETVQGLLALLNGLLALLELANCQLELGHMHAQEQQRLLRPRVLRLYQVRDDAIQERHCTKHRVFDQTGCTEPDIPR